MEQKKTIRVNFLDFWPAFREKIEWYKDHPEDFLILRLLNKHFNIVICDDADYVFFSAFGESHWKVPDSAVKIFYTPENLAPDFNACDFAIGFEWMDYEDRYIRFPFYFFCHRSELELMCHKHELGDDWDLKAEKTDFCSFVVSNPICAKRNEAFKALNEYKKVDSGGSYLNNTGGPVKDKLAFESTHKFSICYENTSHNGYTTEKLINAFAARTVPIYWGDPEIGKVFNTKSFINASDYDTVADLVEEIKRIDNDDQLYMSILREPHRLSPRSLSVLRIGLSRFLSVLSRNLIEETVRCTGVGTSGTARSSQRWIAITRTGARKCSVCSGIRPKAFSTVSLRKVCRPAALKRCYR